MCGCRFGLPLTAVWLFVTARAVYAAGGPMADPMGTFIEVALHLPALLLGIGLHEFAHAYVATELGDSTPQEEGRLSLNPLDHLDPVGSTLILLAFAFRLPLLGWGLPVRVTGSAFRNPITDMMKVGIAGPLMNLAVASTAGAAGMALDSIGWGTHLGLPLEASQRVETIFDGIVLTNLSLAAFNLLPIPPLDGSWVLREYLDSRQTLFLAQLEPIGFLLLLMLMQTPALDVPFRAVARLGFEMKISYWALGSVMAVTVLGWFLLLRSLPYWRIKRGE